MQSQNFIKVLILLGFVRLGYFVPSIIFKHCCKYGTFMDNDLWYKCPLDDVGDNLASRFCQMGCIVNLFKFSNGTNLSYDKLNAIISGLKEKDSIKLHQKVVQRCKVVTDYKMSLETEFDEESDCSAEFSYFLICFVTQLNEMCPEEMKIPSHDCKSQRRSLVSSITNMNELAKKLEASGKV